MNRLLPRHAHALEFQLCRTLRQALRRSQLFCDCLSAYLSHSVRKVTESYQIMQLFFQLFLFSYLSKVTREKISKVLLYLFLTFFCLLFELLQKMQLLNPHSNSLVAYLLEYEVKGMGTNCPPPLRVQKRHPCFRNHVNEIRKVSTYPVKGMTTMSGKD